MKPMQVESHCGWGKALFQVLAVEGMKSTPWLHCTYLWGCGSRLQRNKEVRSVKERGKRALPNAWGSEESSVRGDTRGWNFVRGRTCRYLGLSISQESRDRSTHR